MEALARPAELQSAIVISSGVELAAVKFRQISRSCPRSNSARAGRALLAVPALEGKWADEDLAEFH